MRASWTLALVLLSAGPLSAQPQRYELGRRLKAFEAEWEKVDDAEARKRALTDLPKLTAQFFSLQLGEAARTLDLATHYLKSENAASATQQFIWSLYAVPETRIVDENAKEISVVIQQLYSVKSDFPKQLELQLWFTDKEVVKVKPEQLPLTLKVPVPPLNGSNGLDRKLYFLADGARELRPAAIGVSQIANVQKRIDAILQATEGKKSSIEQATARQRATLISELLNHPSRVPETDLPFAELLANAEQMIGEKPFFTPDRHGQFWMTVPLGTGRSIQCRVLIPKGLDPKKPAPVVFALHGAGVNENMFFESYGAGRIVKECTERGWVLVAPRSAGFGGTPPVVELFNKLAERYPLDAQHVFLVGHSMGAGQALSLAQATPDRFAGIAALGGGNRPSKPEALANLGVFVGIGLRDTIGLSGAQSLNKTLLATGAKNLIYKEYPHIEHLVIVGLALPEVFKMFDGLVKQQR